MIWKKDRKPVDRITVSNGSIIWPRILETREKRFSLNSVEKLFAFSVSTDFSAILLALMTAVGINYKEDNFSTPPEFIGVEIIATLEFFFDNIFVE